MTQRKSPVIDKKLRKAAVRSLNHVMKMVQEEPHPIVISDGNGIDSNESLKEINRFLFQRREEDDNERNNGNHR